jgi:hypothetical protein
MNSQRWSEEDFCGKTSNLLQALEAAYREST